jgi:hypothetical protein
MHRYFKWAIVPILLAGLTPTRKVLIADWAVTVTDETNHPVAGARVSQLWHNYTLDLSGGSDRFTNAEGMAVFTDRQQQAPISYWLARAAWTKVNYGAHVSSGTDGQVWVSDPRFASATGANCRESACTAKIISSQIRLRPR